MTENNNFSFNQNSIMLDESIVVALFKRLLKMNTEINQFDIYFNNKLNNILVNWKTKLTTLFDILFKNNEMDCIVYLLLKRKKNYIEIASYYTGYYNNVELLKSGLVNDYNNVFKGCINNDNFNMIKIIFEDEKYKNIKLEINYLLNCLLSKEKNDIFKYVLEKSYEKYYINYKYLLVQSAKKDNSDIYKYIITKYDNYENFLYYYPIKNNYLDIIVTIVAKFSKQYKIDLNLLLMSLKYGRLDIFKYLYGFCILKTPCDFKHKQYYTNILFIDKIIKISVKRKYLEILNFLVEEIKDFKDYQNYIIRSILYILAEKNYLEGIAYFHDKNMINDINMIDIIIIALKCGSIDIINYLFKDKGLNIDEIVEKMKNNGMYSENIESNIRSCIDNK